MTNVKNHKRTHKEKNNKLTDKTLMIPLGTNNYMSLPLTWPPLRAPCKFVTVSLLAYETSARINLQPFFLPPNLRNIKFKLRHIQSKGLTSAIWSKDSGKSFRISVPTCALPIIELSLKITFIHLHHILHLLFYKSWEMNKIDYLLHQPKLKAQYIPHIGSHIVITMNIVLIQFWHFISKYLLLLLWLIALWTIFFALDMVDWLINNEIIY